jgi:tetratricopeptide (TPR) repeat protein
VTNAGLEHLKGLTQLQTLNLMQTQVTDAGLERLQGLSHLQTLDLSAAKVTDIGLEHLQALTQLQNLNVDLTRVTDVGVEKLQQTLPKCSIAAPQRTAMQAYEEARQLLVGPKKDKAGALKVLEVYARLHPQPTSPHVVMYLLLTQVGRTAEARSELEAAIRINSSDPAPYALLGNIALHDRRTAEALTNFKKVQQLLGKSADAEIKAALQPLACNGLAQVAEVQKDWKEAVAQLRALLTLAPEDLLVRQRLARCLFWQGLAADAYQVLKEAKEIDRANVKKSHAQEVFLTPEAIMGQYYVQYEGPDTGNAEKWFRSALQHAPNDRATRQVVALWALETGKIAFAKEQLDAAQLLPGESPQRIEAADNDRAPNPKSVAPWGSSYLRGRVALWEKDWPAAEEHFKRALGGTPIDLLAQSDLALALEQDDPAARQRAWDYFLTRNYLALALVEQDDPAKKQQALDYAVSNVHVSKNRPDALSTLGWVRFRRNEFEQAQAALDQALKLSGGSANRADTSTYVAYLLDHQGKTGEAKDILDKLLKTDRPFSMRPEAQKLYEKVKNAGTQ